MRKCLQWVSFSLTVLIVLSLMLAGCAGGAAPEAAAKPTAAEAAKAAPASGAAPSGSILFGAVFATTGKYAGGEAGIGNGAKMAIEEINAKGGINGQKLELQIEDTGSEQAGAVNAYNRVVAKNPVVILDTALSSFALAQMPDIAKAQIPTFSHGDSPLVTQQGNSWVLRFTTPDNVTPVAAVQFAMDELKKSKVAIVRVNNEFGKSWEDGLLAELTKRNAKPATVEVFGADDKDMTAQLTKVKSSGADVIIAVADPTTHAVLIKQRKQLGLGDMPYVGSNTAVHPQTLDLLKGGEAEGIYALTSSVPPEDPDQAVRDWNAKYKAKYGIDADYLGAISYDVVMITADAIKAVGTDRTKIRDWIMQNVHGRKGMGNTYDVATNGDAGLKVSIVQVKGGKAPIIKTIVAK